MKGFHYVYILVSEANDKMHYSRVTRDLNARLVEHNSGNVHIQRNTNRGNLKRLAFRSKAKARRFELYLKTGSGREFAQRHF
jgi:putative endonuclease